MDFFVHVLCKTKHHTAFCDPSWPGKVQKINHFLGIFLHLPHISLSKKDVEKLMPSKRKKDTFFPKDIVEKLQMN